MVEIVVSVAAKVSEYLVDPAVRQLGYLFNYRANIEHLSLQVEKLRDARARLQHSVDEAIGNGHIIEDDVCKWMKRADEFIQNACKFLEDEKEARKSCFNGLCPNLKSRYQLSMKKVKNIMDNSWQFWDDKNELVEFTFCGCFSGDLSVI